MRATLIRARLAVIIEEQGFGAAFAFIITGARADRIDMAPVVLGLRMDGRVAIDFAGRGLQDFRLQALGEAQHVDGAMNGGLRGLNRIVLVLDRRGRAGEIVDFVDFDEQRESHVMAQEFEARISDADVRYCAWCR